MKELFAGFLSVSLSGSVVIGVILVLRFVFRRRAPKALFCVLWLVAILRFLLPFQIEAGWSLRPSTPVITGQDTHIISDEMPIPMEQIPSYVPQVQMNNANMAVIDYVQIASVVWLVGVCVLSIYVIHSYLRLKYRLRESICTGLNIFKHDKLRTAILFGYIHPRIYLPTDISEENTELVIEHERAHLRRGDHWLKLSGFICLTLHWFNPLCWLAFHLLCKDIEDACDEEVIKNMEPERRKAYSVALLSCGKRTTRVNASSVAFGESSIRQRILNVLNYRKPSVWISLVMVLSIAFVSIFFLVDPINKHPDHYEQMMNLLGQTKENVCAELEIDEDQLEELTVGMYDTPITVVYEGVELRLRLNFARHNNLLTSFTYYAIYEDNEQMAKDAVIIAKHMWRSFGKGYQWEEYDEPNRLRDVKEEDIIDKIEDRFDTPLQDQWNLTQNASKSAKTWLNQIEVSSAWQEAYGGKAELYNVSPHFYLTYKVIADRNLGTSSIVLDYATGWQPGHYSVIVESDYN